MTEHRPEAVPPQRPAESNAMRRLRGAPAAIGAPFLVLAALLSALVLALAGLGVGPVASRAVSPAGIRHLGGHAFFVDASLSFPPVPLLVAAGADSAEAPRNSTLRLLEDGRHLGPPHSVHADIQHRGEGRFSHWRSGGQTALIFSTSDNSDPRTNARTYVIQTTWLPAPGLRWVAAALLLTSSAVLAMRFGAGFLQRAAALVATVARPVIPRWPTKAQPVHAAWIAAAASLLLVVSDLLHIGPAVSRVVTPEEIAHQTGHAYSFNPRLAGAVPLLTVVPPSSSTAPRRSRLQIFEDGQALGPGQAPHADIGSSGMGRFSHWGDQEVVAVIFSASDNTDPRSNGRRYTIRAPWQLEPRVMGVALALLALSVGYLYLRVARVRHATRVALVDWPSRRIFALTAVAGMAGFAALTWIVTFWGKVMIFLDSSSYLTWSVAVPLGYPWFLASIKALAGSYVWTPVVQILLLAGAITFLCDALWRVLRVKALALLLGAALVCYTPVFRHATAILSESVYVSLILIHIGAALRMFDTPSRGNALLLAISAALIMLVRPAGYFVVLGILFLLIAWRGMTSRIALLVVLPLVALSVATTLVTSTVRGSPSQSMTGMFVFPTVSHLFEPSFVAPEDERMAHDVYGALQPHRESLARLSGIEARYRHARDSFNSRAGDIWDALDKHVPRAIAGSLTEQRILGKALPSKLTGRHKWMNEVEWRFARATIFHRPLGYVETTLTQTLGTWGWELLGSWGDSRAWFATQVDALHADAINTIKLNRLEVPLDAAAPAPERFNSISGRMLAAFDSGLDLLLQSRAVFVGTGALAFIAIFAALAFRRHITRQVLALGYLGVLIHGAVFLIAAVTVMIPRYALSIDPMLLVAALLVADVALAAAVELWRRISMDFGLGPGRKLHSEPS